ADRSEDADPLDRRIVMIPKSAPPRSRTWIALVIAASGAGLITSCDAFPTAADIEAMDVEVIEAQSRRLLDGSNGPHLYMVDGVVVTPEAARYLDSEEIASINVVR